MAKYTFEAMAAATDISNKKAKIIAREFRTCEGRTSIEAGFEKTLAIEPKVIKKYFTTKYIDLEVIKEKAVVKERKKIVLGVLLLETCILRFWLYSSSYLLSHPKVEILFNCLSEVFPEVVHCCTLSLCHLVSEI